MPPRRQKTLRQRGGSKRWIDLPGVTNVDSMMRHVDIQYVMAHGSNEPDRFFVVPENTFVYYIGKSGYVTTMGSSRKIAAYNLQTLYETFFTDKEPKYTNTYPDAHVYVPGDILPMSEFTFEHASKEMPETTVPMGVYRKPFSAELETYLTNLGVVAAIHFYDVETMARLYPPIRSLEFRDDLETPVKDAPAVPKTRHELYIDFVSQNDPDPIVHQSLRYAYIKHISAMYGIHHMELLKPAFWFKNPQVMSGYITAKQFHIDGNLLLPEHQGYLTHPVHLDTLIAAVPSDKPYRLLVLAACRGPTADISRRPNLVKLAQRLSSASKEEAIQCVTSERRNPVFNLSAVAAAYKHLFPMYPRLRVALRDAPKLAEVWRLQNRLFATHLEYKQHLPVEALYDAMKIIPPDDPLIDSIPHEDARDAFRDVVEAIYSAFHPVVQRIEREFATQNRRAAPSTKFLKYTTGRMTRYKKRSSSPRPDPTGDRRTS